MRKILQTTNDTVVHKWMPDSFDNEDHDLSISDAFLNITSEKIQQESFNQGYLSAIEELQRHFDLQLQRQTDQVVENEKQELLTIKQQLLAIKQDLEILAKNELVDFCFELVKHICRKLFEQDKEIIHHMIKQALSLMTNNSIVIKVFISKSTNETLVRFSQETGESLEGVQIVIDDNLAHGDFLIESNIASMNGLLEKRLQKIKSCL